MHISLAITGAGGAGVITAGQLLLDLLAAHGLYGLMRRSYGPQIRGGEAASLLRVADQPVYCLDDRFQLMIALDWKNVDRFVDEIPLGAGSLLLHEESAGPVPPEIQREGVRALPVPMKALAAQEKGGRMNSVALGLAARLLNLQPEQAAALLDKRLHRKGEEAVRVAQANFEAGYHWEGLPEPVFSATPASTPPDWTLTGNEGCGLGALRAGVRFVAAYPITPASDMLEWLSPRIEQLNGALIQAEDELASINMAIGAAWGGVPAMTATSGPGLSLMLEGIGLAVASETPVVVVDVMRGGPSTGIPTKSEQADLDQALHGLHGDAPHLVLGPLDVPDCVLTTQWAVHLAEQLQAPAIVLSDQAMGQSRMLARKPAEIQFIGQRKRAESPGTDYQRYAITADGVSPMAIPGTPEGMYTADGLEHEPGGKPSSAALDHVMQLDKRARKLEQHDFGDLWAEMAGEGELAVLTWGSSTGAVREACERFRQQGGRVRMIALRLLLPAQTDKLAQALAGVDHLLVVEQSHSRQFDRYLRAWHALPVQPRVLARPGPVPFTPGEILTELESMS